MFTPKQPYTQGYKYNKINPYSQDKPDFFLKIDEINFLLIDGINRLLIQPATNKVYKVYKVKNPYELQ